MMKLTQRVFLAVSLLAVQYFLPRVESLFNDHRFGTSSTYQNSNYISCSSRHSFSSSSDIRSTSFVSNSHQLHSDSTRISHASCDNMLTMVDRRDKKNRKKKTKSASTSSSPASPAQPTPQRVSNDINIPIRQQIRYGKLNKQFREAGGSTSFRQNNNKKVVRTKYRRTWDEEEIEQKAEERRRRGQNPDWDVILNRTSTAPLVIVDGYNIIYKWARLKKHMAKGDPQRARQLLLDDLENLRSIKGWRIEVVYDGAARNNRRTPLGDTRQSMTAADRAETKDVSKFGVRQVFTGSGVEADSYIESRCADAKNVTGGAFSGSFIVATDDALIRLAGQNAGALCMSADRFVNELKAVKKAVAFRVEAAMAKVNGEAMRPEKLWGTNTFTATSSPLATTATTNTAKNNSNNSTANQANNNAEPEKPTVDPLLGNIRTTADGKTIAVGRFGRGAVIIEDKRNRKPRKRKNK